MIIGVVIPDTNNRPMFLKHCLDMMERQTIAPDYIRVVNESSGIPNTDTTYRYRKGLDTIFNQYDCDVCFFIENDNWYKNTYIEEMLKAWELAGKPNLFGQSTTIYYHLGLRKFKRMSHPYRAAMFSSMVTKDILNVPLCADTEVFIDKYLWKQNIFKATFISDKTICLGIKHEKDSCASVSNSNNFPYDIDDSDLKYLKSVVDLKSLMLYANENKK
ncbi:hypothetical protein UFOVP606_7 [uncultured Caudovirales phage]|uniref:Uncharacterized protein n=1 Tax=uncultured Caudovirales phage TaxID=2100421 RepID=A0A6J5N145_9CAUD|nr:hypothetical protein UFOVP606_7 [uncultured Caudovirales phage]